MQRLIRNGICLPKNTIIFIQDLFGSKFVRLGWSQVRTIIVRYQISEQVREFKLQIPGGG